MEEGCTKSKPSKYSVDILTVQFFGGEGLTYLVNAPEQKSESLFTS